MDYRAVPPYMIVGTWCHLSTKTGGRVPGEILCDPGRDQVPSQEGLVVSFHREDLVADQIAARLLGSR